MASEHWHLDRAKGYNRRVLGPVEDAMREEMEKKNAGRDTAHLHPSEMAKDKWCLRQTYYKMTETEHSDPEHLNIRRMNILAEGNAIHDKWQTWLWRAGILWGKWHCLECGHDFFEVSPSECALCCSTRIRYREVPISEESISMIGHADGSIRDDEGEALLEIKSVGLGTIRWDAPKLYDAYARGEISLDKLWDRIKRPLSSHLRQISLYMWATGVHKAVVLYEWKPDQSVKEFHIEFDYEVIRDIVENAETFWDYYNTDTMPPKIDGAMKSKQPCVFCPWKKECWS